MLFSTAASSLRPATTRVSGTDALLEVTGTCASSNEHSACVAAILQSLGSIKAAALRMDLSIGKSQTGFANLVTGQLNTPSSIGYNYSLLNTLVEGLMANQARF